LSLAISKYLLIVKTALEDWQRELLALIQQADTILSIVSPHFVASKMCVREVEQARLLAKRIAPVMIAPVKSDMLPTDVAQIQWLDFSDESLFTRRAEELVRALNSDMDWLKEHTRFAELARRWVQRRRPQEALLRGRELQLAVDWLFSGRARPR
jgi:hypothetical protein